MTRDENRSAVAHKLIVQLVTPEMAAAWLRRNDKNRPVKKTLVDEYARAMREGRWRTNGETLKIAHDGRILDGQHRLLACVKSNIAFESYVASGIDPESFDTIDIGRTRLVADIIGIDGVASATTVAAAVRVIVQVRTGQYSAGNVAVAADETRRFLDAEPGVQDSVAPTRTAFKILASSICVALHYLFSEKDPRAADLFFSDLASGAGISNSDPVHVLRERLIRNRISKAKLARGEIIALVIRAWERRRKSSNAVMLRGSSVADDGKRSFPPIV